jgi:hypothetical protein
MYTKMQKQKKQMNWGPPLRSVNTNYYHPMIHTPPTGLEKTITLDTLGPQSTNKLIVKQNPNSVPYKAGPDKINNRDDDYGQYVDVGMGGMKWRGMKRRGMKWRGRKTRKNKRKTNKRKSRRTKSR